MESATIPTPIAQTLSVISFQTMNPQKNHRFGTVGTVFSGGLKQVS